MMRSIETTTYDVTWTYFPPFSGIPSPSSTTVTVETTLTWSRGVFETTFPAFPPVGNSLTSQVVTLQRPSQLSHGTGSRSNASRESGSASRTRSGSGSNSSSAASTALTPLPTTISANPSTGFASSNTRSHGTSRLNSATSTPATSASRSNYSPATLAGVAIGCAIAGAAIAVTVSCLLLRRKRRASYALGRAASTQDGPHPDGTGPPDNIEMALTKINTDSTLDDLLPAPIQNNDLADAMRSLSTAIKNHAHSYYGGGDAFSISSASAQLYYLLGSSSPVTVKALLPLLSNPLYKLKSIRFLLAWSILQDANTACSPDRTLLPPELAKCIERTDLQSTEGTANHHKQEVRHTDVSILAASRSALLSKWRQMTVALMQPTYEGHEMSPHDHRQPNIHELVEALDAVLEPLASRRTNVERRNDLENLVKEAARLMYLIFSLPTTWEFDWRHPENKSNELVVFPALRQTSDDQGRVLADPQTLTQPHVASMGRTDLRAT